MSMLRCTYDRGGVHLPALDLWLDPHHAKKGKERVFVSHAHSDHIAAHREIIAHPATARLMHSRVAGKRTEHALDWHQPRTFETGSLTWSITLLPAGHILGSAMALIEADGRSLLYTGDFKLRPGPASEACHPVHADVLVMETTFGRPLYVFPPVQETVEAVRRFCRENLDQGHTPVLLGYSLGKTQEALCGLADSELAFALHPAAAKATRIYEEFGIRFPTFSILSRDSPADGKVLLCPPGTRFDRFVASPERLRKAVLTGWAVHSSCRFRHQADAAFPWSDHADFPDLHRFVRQVAPTSVLTLHGFAADFAQSLRDAGFDARAISENDQLHLPFGTAS
ncbi:MAG: MBL fold metallo-hydrolase [Verrucomicrobiales bacterium]|nr:MBL fold metallo-hydrolase [Verrucomicrobiales bacterium]